MSIPSTELPPTKLAHEAVALAEKLLIRARNEQSGAEGEQSERLARLMNDPLGKELTIAMVDQAFRSHQPARIADQISHLLDEYGTPQYMDWWERTALTVGGVMGHYLPAVVVPAGFSDQRLNAAYLAERGAAIALDNKRLDELEGTVTRLLDDDDARARMAQAMRRLARPDAASQLADLLEAMAA